MLRVVDFSSCDRVSDRTLIELAEHARNVERVVVARCLQITGIGVQALLDRCPRLRELNAGWCPRVDDEIVEIDHDGPRQLALERVQLSWTAVSLPAVLTLIQQV